MRKHSFLKLFFFSVIFLGNIFAQGKVTDFVNPYIGTGGHGHTYPGVSLPFGMVQLSPDTDIDGWDWCSGYHYSDTSIMGFSHTHLSGTGIGDYGDILIMPTTGELKTEPGSKSNPGSGYRSKFSHDKEIAKAGYYSVFLEDYNIKAELTATTRTGFHKYTFPKSENANIIIDLVHGIQDKTTEAYINIIDENTIQGFRRSTGWANDHCVYFYAKFSKPFKVYGIVENGKINKQKSKSRGTELKAFVSFPSSLNETVLVKVGISHTSLEGARKNLERENPSWNFDKIKNAAEKEWEKELSSILVEGKNKDNKTIFYTALYHSLLAPNIFSDVDGRYTGLDKKIRSVKNGNMYTVFSLWDTFRAAHPLFTIIDKKRALEMVNTLISKYDEYGLLPVWELAANETGTMIGYHSIPVITDAYFKNFKGFDAEKAYQAMKKSAMQDHLGLEYYKKMGYVPADLENESVSKTLEYAYDDWCIAKMAKELNKRDDYNYFIDRAKFYVNVFDPSTSLMRAKKNGSWFQPFDPYSVSGNYTEANSWQYSFFVPQDINGLIKLMGGDNKFISKLDELFSTTSEVTGRVQSDITGMIGQYAHGNEPSHHVAYLYNYAGAPWKTQEKVYKILTTMYSNKPDGLCGNDDCGQMSSWFVFSAMGFYPVCPGDGKYIIGMPFFDKISIRTGKDRYFTIKAENLSDQNRYIQSVKLNGTENPFSFIKHQDILDKKELAIQMDSKPGNWGTDPGSRPKSSIELPFVPVPFLTSGERVFKDSLTITLSGINDSLGIYYTLDGSDPIVKKNIYKSPIQINKSTILKAACYSSISEKSVQGKYSKIINAEFNKIPEGRSIKLNTQYHSTYTGGGAFGLIDGIKGNLNFHTDAWQGYEGVDLDAVIDLGKVMKLSNITASFLQNTKSWIFYPAVIEYYVSSDGINYSRVFHTENSADQKNSGEGIKDYSKAMDGSSARYIKVYAKNVGTCPPWHIGAGGKAWIFIDEINVE